MKNYFFVGLAMVGLLLFTGCPVATPYTLTTPGTEKIDAKLLGRWKTDNTDAAAMELTLTKADDYAYTVEVLTKGTMYAPDVTTLTGYIATFEGMSFVYFKDATKNEYYVQNYKFDGSQVVISDISLLVGGTDACTSNETYRKEVRGSMKKDGFLNDPVVYTKADRRR